MPEGPEIRRAADEIEAVLRGRAIVGVELLLPQLRRFERRLTGTTVTAVDTRGKAMLTRFDNDLTIYSHNQLYGRWFVTRRSELPDTHRQLRVALHTSSHSALLYSASDIQVMTRHQLRQHPFLRRLGPDILDADLSACEVAARLDEPGFRNRALASLYLDQAFIAGLGNYLRSEILWAARVSPDARPRTLTSAERNRLARQTLRISRRSYRTCGLTVPTSLARTLRKRGWSFEARRFQVFGRGGLDCHACGATIEKSTRAGRNLFRCPQCQADGRGTSD